MSEIKRILLIDDEKSVALALRLLLDTLGFEAREFSAPREALIFLGGADPVDLIICDLRMPELNGLEVLTEAKALRPQTPFILMSAHALEPELKRAEIHGADGFLSKPFSPDDLLLMVGKLNRRLTQGALR